MLNFALIIIWALDCNSDQKNEKIRTVDQERLFQWSDLKLRNLSNQNLFTERILFSTGNKKINWITHVTWVSQQRTK